MFFRSSYILFIKKGKDYSQWILTMNSALFVREMWDLKSHTLKVSAARKTVVENFLIASLITYIIS